MGTTASRATIIGGPNEGRGHVAGTLQALRHATRWGSRLRYQFRVVVVVGAGVDDRILHVACRQVRIAGQASKAN